MSISKSILRYLFVLYLVRSSFSGCYDPTTNTVSCPNPTDICDMARNLCLPKTPCPGSQLPFQPYRESSQYRVTKSWVVEEFPPLSCDAYFNDEVGIMYAWVKAENTISTHYCCPLSCQDYKDCHVFNDPLRHYTCDDENKICSSCIEKPEGCTGLGKSCVIKDGYCQSCLDNPGNCPAPNQCTWNGIAWECTDCTKGITSFGTPICPAFTKCDLNRKVCVTCKEDPTLCPEPKRCDSDGKCNDCYTSNNRNFCEAHQRCNWMTRKCEDCRDDPSLCQKNTKCNYATGFCQDCKANPGQCLWPNLCLGGNLGAHAVCVNCASLPEYCKQWNKDSECVPMPSSPGSFYCRNCTENPLLCGANRRCQNGKCVDCREDLTLCPAPLKCGVDGKCRDCTQYLCPYPSFCNTKSGGCETCSLTHDGPKCPEGQRCRALRRCSPSGDCEDTSECIDCSRDSTLCPAPKQCVQMKEDMKYKCVTCTDYPSMCNAPNVCLNGVCTNCTGDPSLCRHPGYCVNGFCLAPTCKVNSDCPDGYGCAGTGKCVPAFRGHIFSLTASQVVISCQNEECACGTECMLAPDGIKYCQFTVKNENNEVVSYFEKSENSDELQQAYFENYMDKCFSHLEVKKCPDGKKAVDAYCLCDKDCKEGKTCLEDLNICCEKAKTPPSPPIPKPPSSNQKVCPGGAKHGGICNHGRCVKRGYSCNEKKLCCPDTSHQGGGNDGKSGKQG